MALTREFVEAVSQGNRLRVRIMLKDSLLVDTSFEQFNEMIRYAEPRIKDLWISNDEDDEVFSQSPDGLNTILVGLVNSFSKRRVTYLKELISHMYPPKPKSIPKREFREKAVVIRRTPEVRVEFNGIREDIKNISSIHSGVVSKSQMDTSDVTAIREAAMRIVNHCDKILESRCR